MPEQIVEMAVYPLPVTWSEHEAGRVGSFRGRASRVLILIMPRGATSIVWCTVYAAREIRRQVYTEVEPSDVQICAVCTALELLKMIGDRPAID